MKAVATAYREERGEQAESDPMLYYLNGKFDGQGQIQWLTDGKLYQGRFDDD